MPPTSDYLKHLETSLAQGNATEHTHRPALHSLLTSLFPELLVTNEPRHIACGAPDFVISRSLNIGALTLGYIETKDVGKPLDQVEHTPQLKRYLSSIENLLLTDYIEFRWYVNGERRRIVRLAEITRDGKIKKVRDSSAALERLLGDFLDHQPQEISNPRDLAQRMARLTHLIRDIIFEAFTSGEASTLLQGWREAFAKVLVADLDQPEKTGEFADMLAQTLAYGLFSARLRDLTPGFTRQEAQTLIPRTNPFLRDFFYQITGPQLDDEPFASFVDDLVTLLAHTDMHAVLADFGNRTKQQDPVVHFYETFLAAYDPKLREARGVYFTPEPVVSYIVRSVDYLLKTRFNLPEGLADTTKVTVRNTDPAKVVKGTDQPRKTAESHRVLVLDPATGTGTFLYGVVDLIRQRFMEQGNAGMWPGYVREHLLPRLFGFELLMAPYAVAHFKLALQLAGQDLPEPLRKDWAYDFTSHERIRVYLTNTLDAPHEHTGLPLFTQFLATETSAANQVKQELPVLAIIGNPPYSVNSSNIGGWISNRIRETYYPNDNIKEANPKMLLDDYVKFIRWAQWRIQRTGQGIIGLITNHGYLDNPTFRAMRHSLMLTFNEIYLFDLHGNIKKNEKSPDNFQDENVFDIQQGVSIGIFVKNNNDNQKTKIYHSEIWGRRQDKYRYLSSHELENTPWRQIDPIPPFFLFIPQNLELLGEYNEAWKITDIFPVNSSGLNSLHDNLVIKFSREELISVIKDACDPSISNNSFRDKHNVKDSRDWKLDECRQKAINTGYQAYEPDIRECWYRPLDKRWIILNDDFVGFARWDTTKHFLFPDSLGLSTSRQSLTEVAALVSRIPFGQHKIVDPYNRSYVFPFYLYRSEDEIGNQVSFFDRLPNTGVQLYRLPNLNEDFITFVCQKTGMSIRSHSEKGSKLTLSIEDI